MKAIKRYDLREVAIDEAVKEKGGTVNTSNVERSRVAAFFSGLLELLYPTGLYCLACGDRLARGVEGLLCRDCADLLVPLPEGPCPFCGQPNAARGCMACLREPVRALDAMAAAFPHTDTARKLVHALKYQGLREAAEPLAEAMAEAVASLPGAWDVLTPIPLHPHRLRARGFNQAMDLAGLVGGRLCLPARETLCRVSDTTRQATLDAAARHANMRGAFAPMEPLAGLRVLLVDDVRTTGATAEAAALICKDAGAVRVALLTATGTD
jgi:ComF family protein